MAAGRPSLYPDMMGMPNVSVTAPISYEPAVRARPLVFARGSDSSEIVEPSMLTFASFESP